MYPRIVTLENPKLEKLLKEKSALVDSGRMTSEEIEVLEKEMDVIDKQIQELEHKVDISDINKQADIITKRFDDIVKEMEIVKNRIYERMRDQVPPELKNVYDQKKKEKDILEEARNKTALKVQQKNDKIIPLTRKLMKPFLQNEFEDYDTIRIENGKVVGTIFNHLEDFQKRHLSKTKK